MPHEFVEYAYARKMALKDRVWQVLQLLGIAIIAALVGGAFVLDRMSSVMLDVAKERYKDGYAQGYADGLRALDWKEKALYDPNFTRPLCTAWWFGSTVKDRKLK